MKKITRRLWKNYVNNQRENPLKLFMPQTLADLRTILDEAHTLNRKVKAVGSAHSSSDITLCRDYMIDTHGLNKIFDTTQLKLISTYNNLFFSECGLTIRELNLQLENRGFGLTNMGGFDGQTIAGVISTSTHGSGVTLGAFPDYVKTIFLLTGDGALHQIEPKKGISKSAASIPGSGEIKFTQNDEIFYASGVSMGCMGIIYAVVIEVEKKYMLEENRAFSCWEDVRQDLSLGPDSKLLKNRHLEVLVSPYLYNGKDHKCLVTKRNVSPAEYKSPLIPRGHRKILPEIAVRLIPGVLDFFIRLLINHFPKSIPWIVQMELNTLTDSSYIDKSFKVLNLGADNNLAAYATEISLPSDRYLEGVEEIIRVVNASVTEGQQYLSAPFSLRFVRTNSFFLSMQYDRKSISPEKNDFVCMIEFPTVSRTTGGFEMLARIEAALYKFGGIPHWGQVNHVGGDGHASPARLYPKFPEWMKVYKTLSPEGRFENDFTRRCNITHV